MTPIYEIDAGRGYAKGQKFLVTLDGTYGLYKIKFSTNSPVPDRLAGSYSHAHLAKTAVEQFLHELDEVIDLQERKAAVKKGKERHARKKAKEAEEKEEVVVEEPKSEEE